jgi:hypothetical protein
VALTQECFRDFVFSCEIGLSRSAQASGRRTPGARTEPGWAPVGNLADPGAGGWVRSARNSGQQIPITTQNATDKVTEGTAGTSKARL